MTLMFSHTQFHVDLFSNASLLKSKLDVHTFFLFKECSTLDSPGWGTTDNVLLSVQLWCLYKQNRLLTRAKQENDTDWFGARFGGIAPWVSHSLYGLVKTDRQTDRQNCQCLGRARRLLPSLPTISGEA